MSAIATSSEKLECEICCETRRMATLNCSHQHKVCLDCAKDIFGKMKDEVVLKPKECPWRCKKIVTAYSANKSAPVATPIIASEKIEKKFDKSQSVGFHISAMVTKLLKEGFTDQQIKAKFEADYRRMKYGSKPFLF